MVRHRLSADDSGQQMVEFALTLPAVLLTLLIVFNVMTFASECAKFDRVANDAMRAAVTEPTPTIRSRVETLINDGMGYTGSSRFIVSVEDLQPLTGPVLFDHTRITCKLEYDPWPSVTTFTFNSMGGASVSLTRMVHLKSLVIDHYMPAGVY